MKPHRRARILIRETFPFTRGNGPVALKRCSLNSASSSITRVRRALSLPAVGVGVTPRAETRLERIVPCLPIVEAPGGRIVEEYEKKAGCFSKGVTAAGESGGGLREAGTPPGRKVLPGRSAFELQVACLTDEVFDPALRAHGCGTDSDAKGVPGRGSNDEAGSESSMRTALVVRPGWRTVSGRDFGRLASPQARAEREP